jgi:coenzyme PQQ biosynthesis protein PqqD
MTFDGVRGRHVLLYPEGTLFLNDSAADVLARCDGSTTCAQIVADLDAVYRGVLAGQVAELLEGLAARRLVENG